MPAPRRAAFTLFEVAISLIIVAFGVVSIMALIPVGLKQLTAQRFRIYAACVANQLIDVYANADASAVMIDHEGPDPWDVPIDRKVNAPDLEAKLANPRYGMLPLPTELARRLDSDGDELQRLLDDGGYVYYAQPNVANSWREDLLPVEPPNDLQKMIVGVVGAAQHNASYAFPMKRWPYYATVPGPPLHAIHVRGSGWDAANPNASTAPDTRRDEDGAMPTVWKESKSTYCWAACVDPDPRLKMVFDTFWDYLQIRDFPEKQSVEYRTKLGAYILATVAYAQSTGLTGADLAAAMAADATTGVAAQLAALTPYPYASTAPGTAARKVLALSYLSNALMCLTRWHKYDAVTSTDAGDRDPLNGGVDLQANYGITPTLPMPRITHNGLTNLVRNTRYWYFRYCAENPYDWAVPRPIEHACMMDYPLLELDLFREPASGSIWGLSAGIANALRPGSQALQWRYLSPTPVTTVDGGPAQPFGPSLTYPLTTYPGADDGNAPFAENGPRSGEVSHFTLCNRFDASERCRQLVFWVVDWQSYEDCETAPSAAVDASRYPKAAPGGLKPDNAGVDGRAWSTSVAPTTGFDDLMWGFTDGWGDVTGLEQAINAAGSDNIQLHRALIGSYLHAYRNPEKNLVFTRPLDDQPTGTDVTAFKVHDNPPGYRPFTDRMLMNNPPDFGPPGVGGAVQAPQIFTGRFGADRNGNNRLDRGVLPRTARLRAVTVARFNYYDMRVPCQIK